jgi:hypothetical protein
MGVPGVRAASGGDQKEQDMRRPPAWASLGLIGAIAAAVLATSGPIQPAAGGSHADCTKATATQLVNQNRLNDFALSDPVVQVLCGPFTGPGSETMAVTIAAPTCWSPQQWAVFSFTNGAWKLVLAQPAFLAGPLVAVGSDIQETTPVFRLGDPRCIPSGGTHARVWHWDGTKFVPGPFKQVTPGKPVKNAYFDSPSGVGATCYMTDDPSVRTPHSVEVVCETVKTRPRLYQQKAWLRGNGSVSICRVGGNSTRCHLACGCEETPPPVLAYGQEQIVGRFRCESLRTGMRCTVVRTGKGFLIDKNRAARLGP